VGKLRRYSTFVILLKESPGVLVEKVRAGVASAGLESKSEKEHLVILKKSSRRRNRRSGFAEEIAKSRQPSDLRKVAQGLSPSEQRRSQGSSGFSSSGYQSFCGQ
jgi:hypothetical protein